MEETSIEGEIAEIQEVIRTDPGAYWKDPKKQARLAELSTPQTENEVVAEAPEPSDTDRELDEIREVIRTDPRKYWGDKGMQARFEQLLQGPEPTPDNPIGVREFGFARADIMADERLAPLVKSWGASADRHVQTYYDRMSDLLQGDIEVIHAQEITDHFVGLDSEMSPALARWTVDMRQADTSVRVDLEPAREAFLTTEEGVALKQIWGDKFDQNLTRYVGRVTMLTETLSESSRESFIDKFDQLSPSAAMAIIQWIVRT